MERETDRSDSCDQESHRSDDQPGAHEPDEPGAEGSAEECHDEARTDGSRTNREADHARRDA
ncbi:hypothetical protein [Curtobacterium sp. L1-20]|uniref:hypothetical protein n=1 Tax=Curtobacterium sp. L1-20 TaxID=3138181 RepID=UPI003B5299AA